MIKYLANFVIIGMSISVAENLFWQTVLENELWMGIAFSETYFGPKFWFILLDSGRWVGSELKRTKRKEDKGMEGTERKWPQHQ